MAATLTPDLVEDDVAVSLARALAAANRRARELGVDVAKSLISITQQPGDGDMFWRMNYGPKDYVGRRGGDLTIEVDQNDSTITRVLWGQ